MIYGTKLPAMSSVNYLFITLGEAFVFELFLVRIRVTVYVSSRIIIRRTLYDQYCPYISPELMVKFTRSVKGYFVSVIENGMQVITFICGHIWQNHL